MIAPGRFHADTTARGQLLEQGEQRSALVVGLARGEASFGTRRRHLILTDIGADIERYGWALHGVSPVIYDCSCWGGTPTGVSLRSNRRSDAARFFIDAGGVGGGVLDKSVSRQRADTPLGPSTPASSLLQKAAKNTIGSHRSIEPGYGIIVIP